MYSISLLFVMYGFSLLPSLSGVVLIAAGGVAVFFFLKWEARSEHPVLQIGLLRHNRAFAFSNLAALINFTATFVITFLISLYLQYVRGMTPYAAGTLLVAQPLVQAMVSPFAGRLSDRIEPRVVASGGMSITVIGLLTLAFVNETTSLVYIVLNLGVLGLGFALFASPNTNAIMNSVEKKFYGVASGTVGTVRMIGQMFSMGISVLVFALYLGRVYITPAVFPLFVRSMRLIFLICALICATGVGVSLIGRQKTAIGDD